MSTGHVHVLILVSMRTLVVDLVTPAEKRVDVAGLYGRDLARYERGKRADGEARACRMVRAVSPSGAPRSSRAQSRIPARSQLPHRDRRGTDKGKTWRRRTISCGRIAGVLLCSLCVLSPAWGGAKDSANLQQLIEQARVTVEVGS